MSEKPPVNLPPLPQEWVKSVRETPSSKAPTIKIIKPEDVTEIVDEKDVIGPLEGPDTLAQPTPEESAVTVKTDATIQHESEVRASGYPTVKSPQTMELKAEKAQTFRKMEQDYMEYDQLHNRVMDWLKTVDAMLARPNALEELKDLKGQIEEAKAAVENQMDIDQYGIAKSESGAAPFKVEVPKNWYKIEARLNEIMESMKVGETVREPMEAPTVRIDTAA